VIFSGCNKAYENESSPSQLHTFNKNMPNSLEKSKPLSEDNFLRNIETSLSKEVSK